MVTSSSYTLKFIVTGGGITGLTCAYLLKKGGHEVVVLEKLSHDELLNVSFVLKCAEPEPSTVSVFQSRYTILINSLLLHRIRLEDCESPQT